MGLILDSDYCVAVLRKKISLGDSIPIHRPLYLPVTAVVELTYGALRSGNPVANLLEVDKLLSVVTVLPLDTSVARRMATVKAELDRQGKPVATPDLEIACIALEQNLPLVTHNVRHFQRIPGLILLDWLL